MPKLLLVTVVASGILWCLIVFLENLYTPALINDDMHTVRRSMRDNIRKGLPLLSAFIYTEQHVVENLRYRIHHYCVSTTVKQVKQ